jgi:hypothetical protein
MPAKGKSCALADEIHFHATRYFLQSKKSRRLFASGSGILDSSFSPKRISNARCTQKQKTLPCICALRSLAYQIQLMRPIIICGIAMTIV